MGAAITPMARPVNGISMKVWPFSSLTTMRAHVAFVDKFLDFGDEVFAVNFELLECLVELVHVSIIIRNRKR